MNLKFGNSSLLTLLENFHWTLSIGRFKI